MVRLRNIGLGWSRDLPDTRDLRPESDAVRRMLRTLATRRSSRTNRPTQVDWREYLAEREVAESAATTPAFLASARACAELAQYFERRASGQLREPSASFLHCVTQRVHHRALDEPAELRSVLKTLARFGVPPETLWKPGKNQAFPATLDPILFGYAREWAELQYVRLDAPEATGALVLRVVKSFLAAGFVSVFGSVLPNTLALDGQVSYPTRQESATSPQALLAVGYDDQYRWRSQKGALCVKGYFDSRWGEAGCGWLPYRYVEERLACDFWTLLRTDWLHSGEFSAVQGV